jgi:class 3 adenylate cyclase
MRCPACGFENASGIKFCGECGASLKITCSSCGFANSPAIKFCGECGKSLSEAAKPGQPPPDPRSYTPKHLAEKILTSRSALEGERKQVTVLFADVKESMNLASRLDPEEWHAVLDGFFRVLTDGIHRFEGTVNQYTGDGVMALFGAPIAHEDHASRACYAALALKNELRPLCRGGEACLRLRSRLMRLLARRARSRSALPRALSRARCRRGTRSGRRAGARASRPVSREHRVNLDARVTDGAHARFSFECSRPR